MVRINNIEDLDYEKIGVDEEWNDCAENELTMHTIHAYPAKFPELMEWKAFDKEKKKGVKIKKESKIFLVVVLLP